MLAVVPAATAFASARVRVVNARGGQGTAQVVVTVNGKKAAAPGAVTFGQASGFAVVPAGAATFTLAGASAKKDLSDGAAYTVVALPKGQKGYALEVLRNGKPTGGQAKMRVVHAAPELGSPDIRVGKRTVAQGVKFKMSSPYLTIAPGSYKLAVTKPNGGSAVLTSQVSLAAGTATTVVIAGSGGSPAQTITVDDGSVTPAGAPHTGLGGLADGGGAPWVLALLAALIAGSLGVAAQVVRTRRSQP